MFTQEQKVSHVGARNLYTYSYNHHQDWAAKENKYNIVYQVDCSNCEAVYFGESKQPLKSHSYVSKVSATNCNCENNEIEKDYWEAKDIFSWDQKIVARKAGWFLGRSKELYILWRTLITLTKFFTCLLKHGFLFYSSS